MRGYHASIAGEKPEKTEENPVAKENREMKPDCWFGNLPGYPDVFYHGAI